MAEERLKELNDKYVSNNMTWEQVQEQIPNVWVAITKDEMSHNRLVRGRILEIVNDDDATELICKYAGDSSVRVSRTTIGLNVGYLNGVVIDRAK